MSIFKANKGLLSKAMNAMYEAQGIATQQRDINFGRELLANIREYRIQQAAQEFSSSVSEGIYTSGEIGATSSLQGQLTQPYQYAVDDAERQEKIESLQQTAQNYIKRYKKQAKTARTVGLTVGLVTGLAGAGLAVATGGAATPSAAAGWGAFAGALGSGATGAISGADRNYWGGAVTGTMQAALLSGSAATAAGLGSGASAGAITESSGGSSIAQVGTSTVSGSWASAPTTTALNGFQMSATQYAAVGKLLTGLGSVVKDINNYEAKVPVSLGYTGGNYRQYVQSFRGFA